MKNVFNFWVISIGSLWLVIGHHGSLWVVMAHLGLCWLIVTRYGPFWLIPYSSTTGAWPS